MKKSSNIERRQEISFLRSSLDNKSLQAQEKLEIYEKIYKKSLFLEQGYPKKEEDTRKIVDLLIDCRNYKNGKNYEKVHEYCAEIYKDENIERKIKAHYLRQESVAFFAESKLEEAFNCGLKSYEIDQNPKTLAELHINLQKRYDDLSPEDKLKTKELTATLNRFDPKVSAIIKDRNALKDLDLTFNIGERDVTFLSSNSEHRSEPFNFGGALSATSLSAKMRSEVFRRIDGGGGFAQSSMAVHGAGVFASRDEIFSNSEVAVTAHTVFLESENRVPQSNLDQVVLGVPTSQEIQPESNLIPSPRNEISSTSQVEKSFEAQFSQSEEQHIKHQETLNAIPQFDVESESAFENYSELNADKESEERNKVPKAVADYEQMLLEKENKRRENEQLLFENEQLLSEKSRELERLKKEFSEQYENLSEEERKKRQDEIDKLEGVVKSFGKMVDICKDQRNVLQQELVEMKNKQEIFDEKLGAQEGEIKVVKSEIKLANTRIDVVESKVDILNDEVRILKDQVEVTRDKVDTLEHRVDRIGRLMTMKEIMEAFERHLANRQQSSQEQNLTSSVQSEQDDFSLRSEGRDLFYKKQLEIIRKTPSYNNYFEALVSDLNSFFTAAQSLGTGEVKEKEDQKFQKVICFLKIFSHLATSIGPFFMGIAEYAMKKCEEVPAFIKKQEIERFANLAISPSEFEQIAIRLAINSMDARKLQEIDRDTVVANARLNGTNIREQVQRSVEDIQSCADPAEIVYKCIPDCISQAVQRLIENTRDPAAVIGKRDALILIELMQKRELAEEINQKKEEQKNIKRKPSIIADTILENLRGERGGVSVPESPAEANTAQQTSSNPPRPPQELPQSRVETTGCLAILRKVAGQCF
jgi:hypothetical protein